MNIIIDLIRKKNEHHVFNSEMIKNFITLDKSNEFILDENSSSIELIDKKNLRCINVKKSKFYYWIESSLLLINLFLSKRYSNSKFFLLSATPFQYLICSAFSKLQNKNICIFMHGELAYLIEPIGFGQSIGRLMLKFVFKSQKTVKLIAINAFIFDKLKSMYPNADLVYIEHPIQPNNNSKDDITKNAKVRVGSFGIQSSIKNSQDIYKLSNGLSDVFWHQAELVTIGVSDGTFEFDSDARVTHFCKGFLKDALIPKDEFMSKVNSLDIILFFNRNDGRYELTPSGVLSDCIALNKPILALKTSMLESYFNQYGCFGFLCDDINQMIDKLNDILLGKISFDDIHSSFKNAQFQMSQSVIQDKIRAL